MENKLKELKEEYETQDNRSTAYPIFVTVQERHCVGVLEENHSVSCPYGDGKTKYVYTHEDLDEDYDSEEECFKALKEWVGDTESYDRSDIKEQCLGYIWVDKEWFLTVKGAEEYINCDKHNLGETRSYVHYFNRRNFEMRKLLEDINFKVK